MLAVLVKLSPALQTPLGAVKLMVNVAGTSDLGTVQVKVLPAAQTPPQENEPCVADKSSKLIPVGKLSVTTKSFPLIKWV